MDAIHAGCFPPNILLPILFSTTLLLHVSKSTSLMMILLAATRACAPRRSWPSTDAATQRCQTGSDTARTTQSATTPSESTGDARSSASKLTVCQCPWCCVLMHATIDTIMHSLCLQTTQECGGRVLIVMAVRKDNTPA